MRKTYSLHVEGKNRDRLVEASKHDIRKYAKRERSRSLPPGVDFWDFDCKFGTDAAGALPVHFGALMGHIDAAAASGATAFYVEVVTKNGFRTSKPQAGGATTMDSSLVAR